MLNDTKLKSLKPKPKQYKEGDSGGLYALVKPTGSILWRWKYRLAGKEKALALGKYPAVSLKEARAARDTASKLLATGTDPAIQKRRDKVEASNTFEAIALEWFEKKNGKWTERYSKKMWRSLELDIFPSLGGQTITSIEVPDLKQVLDKVQSRGALEVASKLRQRCEAIFTFAIATGRATTNPAMMLKGTLEVWKVENRPSIDPKELPQFMRDLETVEIHPINKLATEILLRCFVRTNEMRFAPWSEINLDSGIWEIPAERMKMERDFIVPLSSQVVALFRELKKYTGDKKYAFASPIKPNQPISENAVLDTLYRMGYKGRMTGHGFRHLASTLLNEMGYHSEAIERQLSHVDGSVRGVYNKAQYIDERTKIMKGWSDYLDSVGDNVVTLMA